MTLPKELLEALASGGDIAAQMADLKVGGFMPYQVHVTTTEAGGPDAAVSDAVTVMANMFLITARQMNAAGADWGNIAAALISAYTFVLSQNCPKEQLEQARKDACNAIYQGVITL